MRPRRGFRVILHRKCLFTFYAYSFNALIIQVKMGDLHIRILSYRLRVHTKAMILRGDLAFAGDHIFYRVIQAAVSVVHLKSRDIICQCQQLVAQANTKYRLISS